METYCCVRTNGGPQTTPAPLRPIFGQQIPQATRIPHMEKPTNVPEIMTRSAITPPAHQTIGTEALKDPTTTTTMISTSNDPMVLDTTDLESIINNVPMVPNITDPSIRILQGSTGTKRTWLRVVNRLENLCSSSSEYHLKL